MTRQLLELRGICTDIGGYRILQGVDLDVPEGAATVLLGRNGAGKSTTLRSIMGYLQPRAGEIRFVGERLTGHRPYQAARRGLGYMPEEGQVFVNLSVCDNLALANRRDAGRSERVERALTFFPDLRRAWKRPAGTLSGGQRQMLGLARVLVMGPRLWLVDEPSKGLSPGMVAKLAEILCAIKQETTILLVEQNFRLASSVGDFFSVLDEGRTRLSGSMVELVRRTDWQLQYLGFAPAEGSRRT